MKLSAVLILIAVVLSAVLPPALPPLSDHGMSAELGTLDVCHSAIPALSTSGEMPCLPEYSCCLIIPELCASAAPATYLSRQYLLAFQDERPPES